MDLTGGLELSEDEVTGETPSSPTYREGVSMWIWDDAGRVGLPRIAVEAVGAKWETARDATVNLALPDGRVLLVFATEPPYPAADAAGRPRVFGAGPLRFDCVEPFAFWRLAFDGHALETTVEDQVAGRTPLPVFEAQVIATRADGTAGAARPNSDIASRSTVPLAIEVEARMAAPAWKQGSLGGAGFIPGEDRFEQLFTAEGLVRIGGQEIPFAGGGLRIHRKGGNRTASSDFFGHCWHSALFSNGKAFGFIRYHPRPDGSQKFSEGWVMEDGLVVPAQVIDTPWIKRAQASGEKFAISLRTPKGEVGIDGETTMSVLFPKRERDGLTFPPLQQGIARYSWDGESAYGMIERSAYFESQ